MAERLEDGRGPGEKLWRVREQFGNCGWNRCTVADGYVYAKTRKEAKDIYARNYKKFENADLTASVVE